MLFSVSRIAKNDPECFVRSLVTHSVVVHVGLIVTTYAFDVICLNWLHCTSYETLQRAASGPARETNSKKKLPACANFMWQFLSSSIRWKKLPQRDSDPALPLGVSAGSNFFTSACFAWHDDAWDMGTNAHNDVYCVAEAPCLLM